jgi:hypothetical protein
MGSHPPDIPRQTPGMDSRPPDILRQTPDMDKRLVIEPMLQAGIRLVQAIN